jgi:CheY-like chemotaxis protein
MASSDAPDGLPPRVLLIMPEQWPRALLRAALREAGYDALGAPSLDGALRYRARVEGRGPVRLIVMDQAVVHDALSAERLDALRRRHDEPPLVLLASAVAPAAARPDAPSGAVRVLRRPASIADVVAAVQSALPLPAPPSPLDG